MTCRMEKIEPQVMPAPPNTIASLRAGFDVVANHIAVISIPIALDLVLWLGPHLQLKTLITRLFNVLASANSSQTLQPTDIVSSSLAAIQSFFAQFNLFSLLRTIPVGIPSLMAFKLPVTIPSGQLKLIDITNPFAVLIIIAGILFVGLGAGTFFYTLITQISLSGQLDLRGAARSWVRSSVQVLSLAIALLILYIVVSVPSSCAIYAIGLLGLPLGQFSFFLYFGVLIWLAFPLIFSAHGIFVNKNNALISVQRSMVLTRLTLPSTGLFLLFVFAISEGLDILWRVPPDNSWLTLIGVGGHAFVASALLAASIIYYRDADTWTQETLRMAKAAKDLPLQGS